MKKYEQQSIHSNFERLKSPKLATVSNTNVEPNSMASDASRLGDDHRPDFMCSTNTKSLHNNNTYVSGLEQGTLSVKEIDQRICAIKPLLTGLV